MIKEIKNICVDCDDVIVDFHTALMNWHNATYGTSLKLEDFTTYLFNQVWGGAIEEAVKKVNDFHHSVYSKEILPIEGAREAIDILFQQGKRLFLGTSRPLFLREDTEALLDKYFRGKFSEIIYCSNHYSKAKNSGKSKGEICKSLNALLIDDSLDYIKQCSSLELNGVLFGDYPWNQNGTLPFGVLRADNWKEVLEN